MIKKTSVVTHSNHTYWSRSEMEPNEGIIYYILISYDGTMKAKI